MTSDCAANLVEEESAGASDEEMEQTDASFRYVLSADAPYLNNMAALWAADPILAEKIEAVKGPSYPIEVSASGLPTLVVDVGENQRAYFHSRHRPMEEAERLVEGIDCDASSFFYLFGVGLGYHVELLFDRCGEETIFCVFEPDARLLRTLFETRDVSRIIGSGRLMIFTTGEKPEIIQRLERHSSLVALGAASVEHPASVRVQGEFHGRMKQYVGEFESYCRAGLSTLVRNARRTAENVAANLGWYAAAPSLERLREKHRGAPAIIVSAGPSLRKNKHLLKDADGKAVFIAVQTTLQPLLEMGIEPQYVTSLDYHDICTRFFEKLPPTLKTELIAEPKATSLIFDMNPGPLTLLGNDFADRMLREMDLSKARLRAGATVAHLAFYLADFMGCDPIIFVGQDLGFSDGLCYAPGTSYEDVWRPELSAFCTVEMKQWEQIVRDRPILRRIADQQGHAMYTEERLFTYLQQFERDFAASKRRIIDATEGGALKRGARTMRLSEALGEYCSTPLPLTRMDHPGLKADRTGMCRQSLEKRLVEAGEIEAIARQTLPLLEEVRDHLEEQGRVNRAIARIDALRNRMDGYSDCYALILQMTQCTELERFKHDRHIAAAKVGGVEKQRRQVCRDIDNVRGILGGAEVFRGMIREVMKRLENWWPGGIGMGTPSAELRQEAA